MSRYFSSRHNALTPYVPGEQPRGMSEYVKLNTNENPFPPSEKVEQYVRAHLRPLNLYSDPMAKETTTMLAKHLGVDFDEVLLTNGSDEILNFAFMAFCDETHPAAFADITYGFYPVFAQLNRVPYVEIPLEEDFTIDINKYIGINKTIFIANPNAPTGICLSVDQIEQIVKGNPDNVVVIDEAYIDFGGVSCVPLIHKYDNLLVTQTFSKSRSLAGGRLGFGVGCKKLIADLNTIKYSTNPYNVNSMTLAYGAGMLEDDTTVRKNCETIMQNREYTTEELKKLGFRVLLSKTNFVFATHPKMSGDELYEKLKENGVLVRHFGLNRIKDWLRITIGTKAQMDTLIEKLEKILETQA